MIGKGCKINVAKYNARTQKLRLKKLWKSASKLVGAEPARCRKDLLYPVQSQSQSLLARRHFRAQAKGKGM